MSTITKDLGVVTAYGYAVSKGYTGTEEEFAELMASYATVAESAAQSATTATEKAEQAAQAVLDAVAAKEAAQAAQSAAQSAKTSAESAASSASTSATNAASSASTASTAASTASTAASTASTAASTASTKASEAAASATSASGSATTAQAAQTAAETAQSKAEDAQEAAEQTADELSAEVAQIETNKNDIANLKSDLNSQGQLASSLYGMIPEQTATGWCLNGTGGSRSYTGCNLVKYAVTEGQELYVILSKDTDATNAQGVYQFQDAKSVPTGDNSHLIGDPVTVATTGKITVPTGATYLIVSQLSSNKTNVVMDGNLSISAIKNNADKAPLCYVFPIWNVTKYGISISGKTIHVGKDGFGVFYNGSLYYIAATDRTTEYDFTAQYGNSWLVIDPSKLTNKGARQDPDVVMKLVTNSSLTTDLIPVAYIFALKDSFDFFGAFRIFRKSPTTEQMDSAIEAATARATSLNPNFLMNMVGAHAGSTNGTYALNSMIGYKSAITNGDKLIEGDIRFSSDLIPVMFHDETLSTSNIANWQGDSVYVGAKTLAELQAYTLVKNSGTMPTLEEYLLLCKKFGVIAELDLAGKTFKSDASTEIITQTDMLNIIIALVEETGMGQSVVFTLSASQARTMMGITGKYPVCVSNMTTVSAINGISDIVASFPLVFCSIGTTYTEEIMSAIRANGDTCKAKAWTIDTLTDMDSAFEVGVSYALSNAIYQDAYNEHVLT